MRRPMQLLLLVSVLVTVFPTGATAQEPVPLPMNTLTKGSIGQDGSANYAFEATVAGVLTVFVHTDGDADLTLEVSDDLGQTLDGGMSDSDLFGHTGTEQVSVLVRRLGVLTVRVGTYSGSADFEVGATWLAAEVIGVPEDPDGHPDRATPLMVGTPVEGAVDPSQGDDADWYVITAETAGLYTIVTEGQEDVYLEYYLPTDFSMSRDRSDSDEGGAGNESVTVRLEAGERAYLKVGSPLNQPASYSMRAGVM